jgi:hypothetical protein
VSTGSGLTTLVIGASRPTWSVAAARAITHPSTSFPANRTRTRVPGTALADIGSGTV